MRRIPRARPIPPKVLLAVAFLLVLTAITYWRWQERKSQPIVTDYASCVATGNPILESYPEQCTYNGQSYIKPGQNIQKPY